MDERDPRLGEELLTVPELAAHVHSPTLLLLDEGPREEPAVDRHRPAVAEEHPAGNGWEPVPSCEEAADLVEQGGDHAAVREPGAALVALVERELRLVAVGARLRRLRQMEADWVVAAAEAGRVVVRRDPQRMPPRSKCALKKFSEPEVAIAAEAEISSASVAAATTCAKR